MNLIKLLQTPSVNAIIGGLMIYILIYLSNKGSPMLGAVMSSMPIGLLGLIAIEDYDTKKKYVSSALYVNIIIVIMWIINNHTVNKDLDISIVILLGFLSWLILSGIYYVSVKYLLA